MPFDFRDLVGKYQSNVLIEEETGGYYDYEDGGKWKATTKTRETKATIFNLSSRDARNYTIQYGEGGSFTREDIKVYIYEPIVIGAKITHKGNIFTISAEVDHADHAHGLRIYIGRRAGKIQNANTGNNQEANS